MTSVGSASLGIVPSFDGFQSKLERGTTPGLLSAGRRGGTQFGDVAGRSAGQRFGSVFRTAAKAGILGGFAVAAGAIKLGADAIGEAREAQKVGRQTRAVIKSTGGAAKTSAKDVGRLATNLSKMAGIDDELIQKGENVLLTFKNIRNEQGKGNKVFNQATKAALDLSVAMGKDLGSASLMVGKALNDPVAGMTALGRAGVQFTADQKEQIKALVESGDQLGAQKIILRELNSEFAGSAKSQADSSDRLKVAFDNVKESLGKALLPVMQEFSRFLLRKGIPAAQEFSDWFTKEGVPALHDFIDEAKPVANKWLPKIGDAFETAGGFAKDAAGFAGDLISAFDKMPGWVKKVLIGGVAGGLTAKKLGLDKAIGGALFSKGATPANPLYVLDVGKGVGTGKLGTGSKVFSALGKGGLLAAFGIEAVIGTKMTKDAITEGIKAAIGQGSFQGGRPGGSSDKDLPSRILGVEFVGIGAGQDAIDTFNRSLDKSRTKIIANKQGIEEFGESVRTRVPRTIETKFTLLGIDVANAQINGMFDTFIARNNRLQSAFSGSESSTGQPPNHSPGKPTDPDPRGKPTADPRGRPTVIINGDVRPNDSKEFFNDMQRRSISGSQDGWR